MSMALLYYLLVWLVIIGAPRRVLMRCMARCEVVSCVRTFLSTSCEFPSPIRSKSEETHKCPVGKVPIEILQSNQFTSSGKYVSSQLGGLHTRLAHPIEE